MTVEQRKARAQRRRALLEELEQVRRLRARVAPWRARQRQVQRLTRLSI